MHDAGHEEEGAAEAHRGADHSAVDVLAEEEGQRPPEGYRERGSPPALACPSPSTSATDGDTSLDEALALVRLPAGALLMQGTPPAKQAGCDRPGRAHAYDTCWHAQNTLEFWLC